MACNPNRFDTNCDGCRHCTDCPAEPGAPGILHHDPQAERNAAVWRRHVLRGALIRERGNN